MDPDSGEVIGPDAAPRNAVTERVTERVTRDGTGRDGTGLFGSTSLSVDGQDQKHSQRERARAKRPIPDDFRPTEDSVATVVDALGYDPGETEFDRITAMFCDHYRSEGTEAPE